MRLTSVYPGANGVNLNRVAGAIVQGNMIDGFPNPVALAGADDAVVSGNTDAAGTPVGLQSP
jgi:hypothetical protein